MKIGKVTKHVELLQQAVGLENSKVLMVEMEGTEIAALDRVGAKPGDRVLVVMSQAAGRYSMEAPADAVVIGVVRS